VTDLRPCCQQALLDGCTPEEHYRVCEARAEDPQTETLFDINPQEEGGPHVCAQQDRVD
jgi:hypothetical protein